MYFPLAATLPILLASASSAAPAKEKRNDAYQSSVLLCVTPGNGKCGISATYTDGQRRETVHYQTGGTTACAYELLRKHSNSAGFYVDINAIGSAGAHIGYNPTGKDISLGNADHTSDDQQYLNARCQAELGFGNVDRSSSVENFWGNLATDLFN
jgi:hypothetical protein